MDERLSSWEQNLSEYLSSKRHEPFQYGKHDCCTFVSGAVEAITGENPMADIDRDYDTKIGSVRVIKSLGYTSLEQVLDDMFYPCSIGFAQTGDLAFYDGSFLRLLLLRFVVVGGFETLKSERQIINPLRVLFQVFSE